MKKQEEVTRYFFVDESGDSTFYDARGNLIIGKNSKNGGCASYLMLGFVQTDDPKLVREKLSELHKNLCEDPYFSKSKAFLNTTAKLFHATDDPPEIRREIFKLIKGLPIRGEFIFARKRESTFRNSFGGKEAAFYDHLVAHLFSRKLHSAKENKIYFATRGVRNRQKPLEQAVQKSVANFKAKFANSPEISYFVQCQSPTGEPCLQVVDYLLWAVQRVFTKQETRFFEYIQDKIDLVWDLYDTQKYPKNLFTKSNPLTIDKISPLIHGESEVTK